MESIKLNQMKASEVHRIIATVLEVMENANFETKVDVILQECEEPDRWKVVFQKKTTSLEELNGIKQELGENFKVTLAPKDKTALTIIVEAPSNEYAALLDRKPQIKRKQERLFEGQGLEKTD